MILKVASRAIVLTTSGLAGALNIHPQTLQLQMLLKKRAVHHLVTVGVVGAHDMQLVQELLHEQTRRPHVL